MFYIEGNTLVREFDNNKLWIKPYGKNGFRVMASPEGKYPESLNALVKEELETSEVRIKLEESTAEISNGKITARITKRNRIVFTNDKGEILLEEYIRQRAVVNDMGNEDTSGEVMRGFSCTLKLEAREFRPNVGGDYSLTQRFESDPKEKIYGMGQYQHEFLDLKNCSLELAHRNSQVTIPFYLSSKNYGFLWNNPGIGEVSFNKNKTEWKMHSTKYVDYLIISESSPAKIIEEYSEAVGRAPEMPEELLGLWQSKMRYHTQEEVLNIAYKYKERGIIPSTLVIDFFHWTEQGHFDFDERYWPNPQALVDELNEMGIKTVISVWPTVSQDAKNFQEFVEKGFLINVNKGMRVTMHQKSNTIFMDPTNPKAREHVWEMLKNSYYSKGIDMYWLDVAEPGYAVYDFDNYKYFEGPDLQVGNLFPTRYAEMIYDGLREEGKSPVTLIRGAWAGSQRLGTLLWSGDIDSSFGAFRNQVNTGLNVSIAGNPWWTTDIGGFHGGNIYDEEFRELIIRWFQYATFSPILRMHGDRQPHTSNTGSGADNEIWSYGEEVEAILTEYINIREYLRPYIKKQFDKASSKGTPLMRPLFYDFADDQEAWNVDNTYMFGPSILVAPVIEYRQCCKKVYLPKGKEWMHIFTKKVYEGGQYIEIETPIEEIPVFVTDDFEIEM